jgi:hypothetical protein
MVAVYVFLDRSRKLKLFQDRNSDERMPLDFGLHIFGQLCLRAAKDALIQCDLTDIVQQASQPDVIDFLGGQIHTDGQPTRIGGNTPRMGFRVRIFHA